MLAITILATLISSVMGSLFKDSHKNNCEDTTNTSSLWVDSAYVKAQKNDEHSAGNVFCYFVEQCKDSMKAKINSINLDMPSKRIGIRIYIDSLGKIYDATWADSGMPERSLPQLFNSLPNVILKQKYTNGILFGISTTDSAGLLSLLHIEKFVSKKDSTNYVSTKRVSDSISNVADRSPKSILEVIRPNVGKFQKIYKEYLKSNPYISGKISIKFTISPQGRIVSISKLFSTSQCASMDHEIIDAVKLMKFDEVPFGNTTVTYAIVLDK